MKSIFLFCTILLQGLLASAQYTFPIKADSVKITNSCAAAELILENHTKNVDSGFLLNKGLGRTIFAPMSTKVSDTIYLVAGDTLHTLYKPNFLLLNPITATSQTGGYNIAGNGKIGGYMYLPGRVFMVNDTLDNFVIGPVSTLYPPTGIHNIELASAIFGIATGNYNTGLGMKVNPGLTTGSYNSGVSQSNYNITTGSYNTAFGQQANQMITTGINNVSIGTYSLSHVTGSPSSNVAAGHQALGFLLNSNSNTCIGTLAGAYLSDTTSVNNVSLGYYAHYLRSGVIENGNVAVGYYAGYAGGNTLISRDPSIDLGYMSGRSDSIAGRLVITNSYNVLGLMGDMYSHHYFFNINRVTYIDGGYTLDVQSLTSYPGTFRAQGLITAPSNILLTTSGVDSAWALPVRDSATSSFVNRKGTENQSMTIVNGNANWVSDQLVISTASYTAAVTNDVIILNASSGTITLPSPVTYAGKRYYVRTKTSGQTATVATASGQIENTSGTLVSTMSVAGIPTYSFISDGTNWVVAN